MHKWTTAVALALAALPLTAQDAPVATLRLLCRIDDGLGGFLEFADGSRREFHVEASAVRARLMDRRSPADAAARALLPGSDDEQQVLRALDAWLGATFTPEQQQELLAVERLPDPRTQEEDLAHQRASLLRTVRLYAEVTRPEVTRVFAGRGTVSLSLQLRLGDGPTQQVLWRRLGDEAFARLHLDTATEPVAIDTRAEGRLLVGLANWLARRLGGHENLWQAPGEDAGDEVRLVLYAWRGYLEATSPRLRSAGTIMDAGTRGSRRFEVTDAQNRALVVRFDYKTGTATPGRLCEGAQLLEVGSAREREVLAVLQRAAELRRRWLGATAGQDWRLLLLEQELEKYRGAFHERK
jgi:hypothetical protein